MAWHAIFMARSGLGEKKKKTEKVIYSDIIL